MDEIPAGLRDFITEHINSVEQITILGLLFSNPEREWSVDEISAELRSVASAVRRRLDDLYEAGVLLRPTDGAAVRFAPVSTEMGEAISTLLAAYKRAPNRVIEMICSKPPSSLHVFANVLKLPKR